MQYILVAAMNAANASENAVSTPVPFAPAPPPRQPVVAAAAVPQPPQVIYVYVTPPTSAPIRTDNSNIKTKKPKPTKPPKTKKPKPPKAPHPDFHQPQQSVQTQPQVPAQPSLIVPTFFKNFL